MRASGPLDETLSLRVTARGLFGVFKMKTELCLGLAMMAGLGFASAAFAQDDDWEFQEDPARQLSIAAARYDAGQMIVVQCRQGGLTVVLAGMPVTPGAIQVDATRADGRAVSQGWLPAGAPGAYRSASSGRAARFMRGGGLYVLRTESPAFRASFDLPTQSANLDRVITACGWAIEDDRDLIADATQISLVDPDDTPSRPRARSARGAPRAPTPRPEAPAVPPPPPPSEYSVSCIVRDLHLRNCRAEHPASDRERAVTATVRQNEGRRVYALEGSTAADSEGKQVHMTGPMIRVVREP